MVRNKFDFLTGGEGKIDHLRMQKEIISRAIDLDMLTDMKNIININKKRPVRQQGTIRLQVRNDHGNLVDVSQGETARRSTGRGWEIEG